ncbi:MAG: hypothetical protein AB7L66_03675 [Gemmatimonadales bacterium]
MTGARRAYLTGCWLLLLVAVAHTMGHLQPPPADAAYQALDAASRDYRTPMGFGMAPSVFDIQQALSLTMSVLTAGLALLGLVAGWRLAEPGRLRALAAVNLIVSAALAVGYFRHRIPPPLVSFVLTSVVFAVALLWPRPRPNRA